MSLKGGPHNGPAKLSEGMVAIDVPPSAPASDYAPLEYVEETEACGCVTTAAPGQARTRLCADHGGAVRSHTTPGQQTLDEPPAELDPAWVAEMEKSHRDEQAWMREQSAADKASGNDGPIDRDALRKRLRASVARRLALGRTEIESEIEYRVSRQAMEALGEFGLAEDLLTGDAPAGLEGGER